MYGAVYLCVWSWMEEADELQREADAACGEERERLFIAAQTRERCAAEIIDAFKESLQDLASLFEVTPEGKPTSLQPTMGTEEGPLTPA